MSCKTSFDLSISAMLMDRYKKDLSIYVSHRHPERNVGGASGVRSWMCQCRAFALQRHHKFFLLQPGPLGLAVSFCKGQALRRIASDPQMSVTEKESHHDQSKLQILPGWESIFWMTMFLLIYTSCHLSLPFHATNPSYPYSEKNSLGIHCPSLVLIWLVTTVCEHPTAFMQLSLHLPGEVGRCCYPCLELKN